MKNREIKFRGLHERTGVWIEGDLYHGLNEEIYINHVIPTGENSNENRLTKVKKGTESQYTGLNDKNGVEIYEGDICTDRKIVYQVEWNQQNACFWLGPIKDLESKDYDSIIGLALNNQKLGNGYLSRKDLDVIGNIFENPELCT